jgi:hypothetical protein
MTTASTSASGSFRCATCKNRIVQKSADGVHIRARGAIVIGPDGVAKAQCHFCRAEIVLPLELTKAASSETERRFVIAVDKSKP